MPLDEFRGALPGPWLNFATALAIGLLIGLERERGKAIDIARRPAGIRTFALAALAGAVAMHLGAVPLLAVLIGGVAVLAAVSHIQRAPEEPGLTTEIGLIGAPLLGGLAMFEPVLAAGLGVVVAAVFAAKAPLHGFVTGTLTSAEVRDGLVFAIATLVIWPLLPDRAMGPMHVLNPYKIWMLVVLVLAMGACGHVAARALGARFGLPIAGFAAGFVSSMATVGSMAGRVALYPGSLSAGVAGAALSIVASFIQMALILGAVSPPLLKLMTPMLFAGGAVAALYGAVFAFRGAAARDVPEPGESAAFSVSTALVLAVTMSAMLVAAGVLREHFGQAGVVAGATLAGFADTHSAAISVATLAAGGSLTAEEAVPAVLAAMTSNAVSKIAIASAMGSAAFSARVIPGTVLSIAATWAVAMPVLFQ